VYLSTLSFFDREQRVKLGWSSDDDFISTELVRAHEIAHQWFGNKVGWQSYHDQWISEGFSNYVAAMFIENKYPRTTRMRQILDNARMRLSEGTGGGTYESIGPLWLGQRLSSSISPDGYSVTVYSKGTWVAHMLRTLMQGEGKNPDEAFSKMVREFLQTFDGKDASTFDLKRVAEKYMTKSMDLRGDGKLDWFFDEWVFDTGIPSYQISYKVDPARDGFIVQGNIKQTGVPDGFVMPVPVYADGTFLGRVVVSDEGGEFRFALKTKPTNVSLDPQGTILRVQ
jgi:aminopeptidase N